MAGRKMYERSYGSKYDEKLSTVEICAKVRAEIKAEMAAGTFPKCKVSVRKTHHRSIHVTISGLGFLALNPRYAHNDVHHVHGERVNRLTPRAKALHEKVEAMLAAYNHDGSEPMTDYFDVNFYTYVRIEDESADYAMMTEYYGALKATPRLRVVS